MILFKDFPSAFNTLHTNTPTTLPSGASGEPETGLMDQELLTGEATNRSWK